MNTTANTTVYSKNEGISPLLSALSSLLSGAWVAEPDGSDYAGRPATRGNLTRLSDGFRLHLAAELYGKADKIAISFSRPRATGGKRVDVWEGSIRLSDPSINVGVGKDAEAIARDIARRLMPDSEHVFAAVRAEIDKGERFHAKRAQLAQQVAQAIGAPLRPYDRDREGSISLGFDEDNVCGDVKIFHADSVSFSLDSVSPDRALALIAFLKSEAFANAGAATLTNANC